MTFPAHVVAARRTPVAPKGGNLAEVELFELGVVPALAALSDAGLSPAVVDEVIIGNAIGPGGNPARSVALAAGCPEHVAGLTLDRQCSSGLDALLLARAMIGCGDAEVVLAGGIECYSRRRFGTVAGLRETETRDSAEQAPFTPWPDKDPVMAEAAEMLARKLGISRRRQDDWAIESHRKAKELRMRHSGEFAPISSANQEFDSFTRELTSRMCERAKTVCGSITAANSAVAADGGAVCVVASERVVRKIGRRGLRIVAGATRGGDPELPGLAPIEAVNLVLAEANLSVGDLSVAEIMEAYASQAIACVEGVGIDPGIVNMSGGALARGHPIGASGAILAVRLFHELQFRNGKHGVAAIASAGGIGTAVLFERH